MQQRQHCVVVEEKTKRRCFVFGKERRTCSWRRLAGKMRANQDRIESDLVESMEQIMIKDDCNRMRPPLSGIGGGVKATDKRFESEDVEGKVFAVSENTREEETSQRGRRANGSGGARLS
jgi:hypothetical protein